MAFSQVGGYAVRVTSVIVEHLFDYCRPMPYDPRPFASYRVYVTVDGARLSMRVVAHDPDDARATMRRDHMDGRLMEYRSGDGGELRVDWRRVRALEIGRVEMIQHLGPRDDD